MKRSTQSPTILQHSLVPDFDYALWNYWQTRFTELSLLSSYELEQTCAEIESQVGESIELSHSPVSFRWPNVVLHAFFIHGTFAAFVSAFIRLAAMTALLGIWGSIMLPIFLPIFFTLPYVLYKLHGRDISHKERLMKTKCLILAYQEHQLGILAQALAQERGFSCGNGEVYQFILVNGALQIQAQAFENNELKQKPDNYARTSRSLFNSTTLHTFYLSGSILYLVLTFMGIATSHYFIAAMAILSLLTLMGYGYFHHRAVTENRQYEYELAQKSLQINSISQALFCQPSELARRLQGPAAVEITNAGFSLHL